MYLEDSQPIPPTHRWGVPAPWHVAPRYEIDQHGLLAEYDDPLRDLEQPYLAIRQQRC